MERKYLPTFAELVDRLSIVQLKSIFIQDHKKEYDQEINDIVHDLDLIIKEKNIKLSGDMIRAILVIMLTNRYIWENESKARAGGSSQDKLLKLTHSINGVRNKAKNVVSREIGERVDLKTDALAAELIAEFGNWDVWNEKYEQ
ncbi:hypothetical protein M1506_00790 [Patescibacteria group bacterium]|nr:hypothetical protein [Patescibacteria group bacterium]